MSLTVLPALVLLGIAAAAAAGLMPGADRGDRTAVLEQGGVSWTKLDISPTASGKGFTIRAGVRDARLDGDAATKDSPYVLWMLGSGSFDDRPWTNSRADEDALGMSHDEQLLIQPVGAGDDSQGQIRSGTYTPSIDGSITYRNIPAGEYELRALVMKPGGIWDGTLARRTIVVE
jgi:hypothetical protein